MCRQKLDVNLAMPALCYVGNVVGLRVPTANSQRSWTRMECSSFHVPWRTKRGKIICFEGGYYCFCSGISQYSIATNIHFKYLWDNYHVIEKRSRRIDDVRKKKSDDKLPKAQQSHKEKTVLSFLFYLFLTSQNLSTMRFNLVTATIVIIISASSPSVCSARRGWSPLAGFPAHFEHSEPPHATQESILGEKGYYVKVGDREHLLEAQQASRLRYESQQRQKKRNNNGKDGAKEVGDGPIKFAGFWWTSNPAFASCHNNGLQRRSVTADILPFFSTKGNRGVSPNNTKKKVL